MASLTKIRIGTRKSPLAMAQAEEVRMRLSTAWPELQESDAIEVISMTTSGDMFLDRPLAEIGGKGLFTKEIEEALLARSIDIAVHSMKDVPTVLPVGLEMACILPREDVRDVLLGDGLDSLAHLPDGAVFGTSSLRRAAQMLMHRPDIRVVPMRGNVQTRLAKLAAGEVQATMLAAAGLKRLGLLDIPGVALSPSEFIPAVSQGAIGIECRMDDDKTKARLAPLHHRNSAISVACERAFLRVLDGSCRTPIAAYAAVNGEALGLMGLLAKPDGSEWHLSSLDGASADAEKLGRQLGEELLAKAGRDFLSR